jgi:hypothetical protein
MRGRFVSQGPGSTDLSSMRSVSILKHPITELAKLTALLSWPEYQDIIAKLKSIHD